MRPNEFARLNLDSGSIHRDGNLTPWWELTRDQLDGAREQIKELGIETLSSPRIQTSHGITAGLSVGDVTNNIQLECVPSIHDGVVNLTALARTTGKYGPHPGLARFGGPHQLRHF